MGSGGTLSTIIKARRCDSPPDVCAPRAPYRVAAAVIFYAAFPRGFANLRRTVVFCARCFVGLMRRTPPPTKTGR
jgi:hypothetical protein